MPLRRASRSTGRAPRLARARPISHQAVGLSANSAVESDKNNAGLVSALTACLTAVGGNVNPDASARRGIIFHRAPIERRVLETQ